MGVCEAVLPSVSAIAMATYRCRMLELFDALSVMIDSGGVARSLQDVLLCR